MTTSRELEPVDPAHFVPWPLAPGAMLGWRDGGRWCTYLGRIANIRTGAEPDMVALGGDVVAFQHHLVPSLAGGGRGELLGEVTAGADDPTPVGWVRVVRDEIGTAAVGRLFTGIDPTPYRAGILAGEWKAEASGVGWVLTRVCWSLPPGQAVPLAVPGRVKHRPSDDLENPGALNDPTA